MSAKTLALRTWHVLETLHLLFWIFGGIVTVAAFGLWATLARLAMYVPWYGWLFFGLLIGALILLLLTLALRPRSLSVDRAVMIAMGNRLIRGAKSEIVMFGGDMSWAPDYRDSMLDLLGSGKNVTVVFPQSNARGVIRNAELLQSTGARLWPLPSDIGLRAMLIDPGDDENALVYLVNRTLRKGRVEVTNGKPGTNTDYEYLARVFDARRDPLLVRTLHRLYRAVSLAVNSA